MFANPHVSKLLNDLALLRAASEGTPLPFVRLLAGEHPVAGLLEGLSKGLLKETGWNGKRHAEREATIRRVMNAHRTCATQELLGLLGEAPSIAELAAEAALSLHDALRAFDEDHYGTPGARAPEPPPIASLDDPAFG